MNRSPRQREFVRRRLSFGLFELVRYWQVNLDLDRKNLLGLYTDRLYETPPSFCFAAARYGLECLAEFCSNLSRRRSMESRRRLISSLLEFDSLCSTWINGGIEMHPGNTAKMLNNIKYLAKLFIRFLGRRF